VHDDLYAKALVLETGRLKVAFVVCDLISLPRTWWRKRAKSSARESGVRGERNDERTHSHTRRVLVGDRRRNAAQGGESDFAVRYVFRTPKLIAESVRLAESNLTNAAPSAGGAGRRD